MAQHMTHPTSYSERPARRFAPYRVQPLCTNIRSLGTPYQHDHHVAIFEAERRRKDFARASAIVADAVKNGTLDQLLWS